MFHNNYNYIIGFKIIIHSHIMFHENGLDICADLSTEYSVTFCYVKQHLLLNCLSLYYIMRTNQSSITESLVQFLTQLARLIKNTNRCSNVGITEMYNYENKSNKSHLNKRDIEG